jgi:hypothetical protein
VYTRTSYTERWPNDPQSLSLSVIRMVNASPILIWTHLLIQMITSKARKIPMENLGLKNQLQRRVRLGPHSTSWQRISVLHIAQRSTRVAIKESEENCKPFLQMKQKYRKINDLMHAFYGLPRASEVLPLRIHHPNSMYLEPQEATIQRYIAAKRRVNFCSPSYM